MKTSIKIFATTLLFFVATFTNAQTKIDWKEKSDFHAVMSQTFHPVEEGNFAPIKARSQELLDKAKAWKKSSIPADFAQIKGIKTSLKQLVSGAKLLNKQVKGNASDEVIKKELTALHDVFHTIVGLCKGEKH
jgi:hypothetical protein